MIRDNGVRLTSACLGPAHEDAYALTERHSCLGARTPHAQDEEQVDEEVRVVEGDPTGLHRAEQILVTGGQSPGDPEILGVISNHQKIERTPQPDLLAVVGSDRFALCKTIGTLGRNPTAQHVRIEGQGRVQMGVAPVNMVGCDSSTCGE